MFSVASKICLILDPRSDTCSISSSSITPLELVEEEVPEELEDDVLLEADELELVEEEMREEPEDDVLLEVDELKLMDISSRSTIHGWSSGSLDIGFP